MEIYLIFNVFSKKLGNILPSNYTSPQLKPEERNPLNCFFNNNLHNNFNNNEEELLQSSRPLTQSYKLNKILNFNQNNKNK